MGIKTRGQRLKHFDERAEEFKKVLDIGLEDMPADGGYRRVIHDGRRMKVGTGKHKRLIEKHHPPETRLAAVATDSLMTLFFRKGNPEHYLIGDIRSTKIGDIQEYVNCPSLKLLMGYLWAKKHVEGLNGRETIRRLQSLRTGLSTKDNLPQTQEEWQLCKQFSKKYPSITYEKLDSVVEEMQPHLEEIRFDFKPTSFIILGQKDTQIRIGIVDS